MSKYLCIFLAVLLTAALAGCKKSEEEAYKCLDSLGADDVRSFIDVSQPGVAWPPSSQACQLYGHQGVDFFKEIRECVDGFSRKEVEELVDDNCSFFSRDEALFLFDRNAEKRVEELQAYCDYASGRYESAYDYAKDCYKTSDRCLQVLVESGLYAGHDEEVKDIVEDINGPGSYYFCYVLGRIGQENEAIDCFNEKIEKFPSVREDSIFWTEYGKVLDQFSNYEGALAAFKEAVQSDNGNVEAIMLLAHADRMLGKCYHTIRLLEGLRKLGCAQESYLVDLAVCYDTLSFPERAAQVCDSIGSDALRLSCYRAVEIVR